ncbi:hypothetical protein IC229_33740 [Spirosoma sp. BT702]|uniref:Uncharacterized protein n=1 Tax=Spirosoma profusum TaxID=2771354 RepID=A0A927AWA2_9BACT|nr:hypothetical protein [Spirosoma profusum]MBD2705620.1 hypothetical protein [Spirosoma profusum]
MSTPSLIKVIRAAFEEELLDEEGNPTTDQNPLYAYYQLKPGQTVSWSEVVEPMRGGLKRYKGNLANLPTGCTLPDPPDEPTVPGDDGKPVWNTTASFRKFIKGQLYEEELRFSFLTPAAGKTITGFGDNNSLPPFLSIQTRPNDNPVLRGTIPADYVPNAINFTLHGFQSDGKVSADKSFTLETDSAPAIGAYLIAQPSDRSLLLLIRPESIGGAAKPKVRFVAGPAGFDARQFEARQQFRSVGSTIYNFDHTWLPVANGEYAVEIQHNTLTKYLKIIWNGTAILAEQTLLDTQPSVNNNGGVGTPAAIVAIDVTYDPNPQVNQGTTYNDRVSAYVKLTTDAAVENSIQSVDGSGNPITGFSSWQPLAAISGDPKGYQRRADWFNAADHYRWRFRLVGGSDIIEFIWNRPSGAADRVVHYPITGGGNNTGDQSGTNLSDTFTYNE